MSNRTSAQINAEIYNFGPALFEKLCQAVTDEGTVGNEGNKLKLKEAVKCILEEAVTQKDMDHNGLWQVIWPRVVYAGTRSLKASAEIESMRSNVELFKNFDNYDPKDYVFDKNEWEEFVAKWKGKQKTKADQQAWISRSKNDPDWDPDKYFRKTTPKVWRMMIKSPSGLKFSAMTTKVEKYLAVAESLHKHRLSGKSSPLDDYINGCVFRSEHLTGEEWLKERQMLNEVRMRFAKRVGTLTALHIMMDLGLKTIKPDRVMTYLFSQLGWLRTLPDSLTKDQVISVYLHPNVVSEMTVRADVLAASLDNAQFQQAHRLLDIWFVKYGQEPEEKFGITVNLQKKRAIWTVLEQLKPPKSQPLPSGITDKDASKRWPMCDFDPMSVDIRSKILEEVDSPRGSTKRKPPKPKKIMTRAEAESIFMKEWRRGREVRPSIYPDRIDNAPKEEILHKIECGMDPGEAFFVVLLTEEDPTHTTL